MLRITDTTTGTVTYCEPHDLHATLVGLNPDAPDDVRQAISDLDDAVARHDPTDEIEAFLAVRVDRLTAAEYLEHVADLARTARAALRDAVIDARKAGTPETTIAEATGLSRSTVRAWLARG